MIINKENTSSNSKQSGVVCDEKRKKAKEQEDMVLEYMRNMDDSKKRYILSLIESLIPSRVTLRPIDGNSIQVDNSSLYMAIEDGSGGSCSKTSPMDVSGVIVP